MVPKTFSPGERQWEVLLWSGIGFQPNGDYLNGQRTVSPMYMRILPYDGACPRAYVRNWKSPPKLLDPVYPW